MISLVLALAPVTDGFDEIARPFLGKYCVACHDATSSEEDALAGGLDLAGVRAADLEQSPEDWSWLLERVEYGEMPPSGHPAPTEAERSEFVTWLRTALGEDGEPKVQPMPAIPLRHLSAFEYANAVRDLYGIWIDPERLLPEDAVGHGFDHVAEAQSISAVELDAYLEVAQLVARRVFPVEGETARSTERVGAPKLSGGEVRGSVHWLTRNGAASAPVSLPQPGTYIVRARVFGDQAGPEACRCRLGLGDARSEQELTVKAPRRRDSVVVSAELQVDTGGMLHASVHFLNDWYDPEASDPKARDRNLAIRWIEVEGPIDASRPSPFAEAWIARAEGPLGVEGAVRELAKLVLRQAEVSGDDVQALLALSAEHEDTAARLRAALAGLQLSSRFLYRFELGSGEPDGRGSYALRGEELATRLAAFLWRSVPDRALLDRGIAGDLSTEAGVLAIAREMLEDPRCEASVVSFAEQWLQLRALRGRRADRKAFPKFRKSLRDKMLEETRRVIVDSFRERRNLWDLVDGSSTFVDRELAHHYGLPLDEELADWARVDLSGTPRRGLLGQGSVLFVTSESTRTSPVLRGKWVLDVLLGSPPPAPPPGADSLPEDAGQPDGLSLRESYEAHRANPNCAACHERMDPLGFGLEAFDAVGATRSQDDPARADLSGVLPDGRAFDGPLELYGILRGEGRFIEALVERMFVYALGRGLQRADRPTIARIVAELDPEHPTFEDLILAILRSPEFRRVARPQ